MIDLIEQTKVKLLRGDNMKNSRDAVLLRQKKILQYLQSRRSERITALSEIFQVTPITIRRDLTVLEQKGYVKREFGVVSCTLPPDSDVQYQTPKGNPTPVRYALARVAASFIENYDLVFFNSSSTALYTLEFLENIHATIITNNGRALHCNRAPGIDLFLTGGEVYGQKQSLVGEIAMNTLSQMTAAKCILGVSGISARDGITSSIMQETAINQQMLRHCSGEKIVVADGSKIGVTRSFFSGKATDITHLITDASADPVELEALRKLGIQIIIAPTEE